MIYVFRLASYPLKHYITNAVKETDTHNINQAFETMTQSANDLTKTAINENTTVTHKNRNNYSYKYSTCDGRYFHCNVGNNDNEVILREDSELGPEDYLVGYATNKKEFVDLVYDSMH